MQRARAQQRVQGRQKVRVLNQAKSRVKRRRRNRRYIEVVEFLFYGVYCIMLHVNVLVFIDLIE